MREMRESGREASFRGRNAESSTIGQGGYASCTSKRISSATAKLTNGGSAMSSTRQRQDRTIQLIIMVCGIVSALWTVNSSLNFHPAFLNAANIPIPKLTAITYTIQLVILPILICCIPHMPPIPVNAVTRIPLKATQQFMWFWNTLWLSWFAYYLVETVFHWTAIAKGVSEYPATGLPAFAAHVGSDFLYLTSTGCMVLCYLVMSRHTVPDEHPGPGLFPMTAIVFFAIAAAVIVEALLVAEHNSAARFFDPIFGLVSGVVLALFVGRLESGYIDLPRWAIAMFYTYAVLQLSYPLLHSGLVSEQDASLASIFIISLALLFKVVLFWFVRSIIVNKTLTYYMLQYRLLLDEGAKERKRVISEVLT